MEKMITLRFPTKCKRCNGPISAGEQALWLGKGLGVKHRECSPESHSQLTVDKPIESDIKEVFTIDYSQLTADWKRFREKAQGFYRNRKNDSAADSLHGSHSRPNWVGCSLDEFAFWVENGYRVPGLDSISSLIPVKPRRRLRYAEEGDELNLDLVWAGSDNPFSEWDKRSGKPGLSVEIHTTFSASFPERTIAAYERWVARALQTLDENGVDMEVSIINRVDIYTSDFSGPIETKIRVRRPGEASDFSNWSAMFSPGGYRILTILSTGMHLDSKGKTVPHGYGMPTPYGKWDVAYDDERNVLVFGNSNSDRDFPENEMTEKLVSVLSQLVG